MSPDGKCGFGHLRYQEHLSALELFNRSIELIPLLSQPWWQSALVLFSRMNDNLEWFIKIIGKKGLITLPIVQAMIEVRPKVEQINLQSLVEKFLVLKTGDITYFEEQLEFQDENENELYNNLDSFFHEPYEEKYIQ
jgi:hypothetical protein